MVKLECLGVKGLIMKAINRIFLLFIAIFTLVLLLACSPSSAAIETAIAETQTAQSLINTPTPQPLPSQTLTPTSTPTLTPVPVEDGDFGTVLCISFVEELNDILAQWNDAMQVAASTQRIALSDRIVDLQNIRRDARQLEEPLCGEKLAVREKLVVMMDGGIQMFSEFMANRDRSSEIERAFFNISRDLFYDALAALEQETYDLPLRIHYYANSWQTGFQLQYTDENEDLIKEPPGTSNRRIGFSDMPFVYTLISPEENGIPPTGINQHFS
jgi:hypothetical protein